MCLKVHSSALGQLRGFWALEALPGAVGQQALGPAGRSAVKQSSHLDCFGPFTGRSEPFG